MVRRHVLGVVLVAVLVTLWPGLVYAQPAAEPLSPAEAVEIDRALDGSVIVVEGEAVGESLRAPGGGRWVNVLGDEVGLGAWMTEEMAERIENFGSYRHDGDLIRVTGTINVACQQHSGEFDLHVHSMEVLSAGQPRTHTPRLERGVVGLVGLAMGIGLWFLYRARRG